MRWSACAFVGMIMGSFWGCETLDPEVPVPAYLSVQPFTIDNSKSDLDIHSEMITDVWVYVDNNLQGAYELPATFPVISNGVHKLTLRPGIQNAGISSARAPYPFYAAEEYEAIILEPGKIEEFSPATSYVDASDIKIPWEEKFEGMGGSNFSYHPTSDTVVIQISDSQSVFKDDGGLGSGGIFLDGGKNYFEMISPSFNNLPINNVPIYLELNYRTNHTFLVGMYTDNQAQLQNLFTLFPQENWNKIYLDFTYFVQTNTQSRNFQIYLAIVRKTDEEPVEMYIDNLKLLHF